MDARMASGFADVDATDDARRYAEYLDAQSGLEFFRALKHESLEALAPAAGEAALDVGCGTGDDVRALAARVAPGGRAAGVDASAELVREARERSAGLAGVEFEQADAAALPFPDASFDAVRVERTLQHVADPAAVVAELARVARPGGRVVAIEPDWDTLVIDAEPLETTRALCRRWADSVRNASIGRRLAGLLAVAGLAVDRVEPRTLLIRELAVAEQQYELSRLARDKPEWLEQLRERDRGGRFLASVTYFFVLGSRP